MNHDTYSEYQALHAGCNCQIAFWSDTNSATSLSKDNCEVYVENLVIAIDCDLCRAFTENDTRPDVIAIRQCQEEDEWLILEMKGKMRARAAEQARAALSRLGKDPMFVSQMQTAHVYFVIKKRRRADNTILRQIGRIEVGSWAIVPRLVKAGAMISCG